jgi:phosphoribosylaminoimidazolecarboxamide formyltransferase / IMP cyclohydrolase
LAGNAIVSVYDKTGLDRLARSFEKHKISIIGSGGTADVLKKMGADVTDVSLYTGYAEMPGGLVKTLHPRIHAGILGDWEDPAQKRYLQTNNVRPFDFVVVNLYPFSQVVRSDPDNFRKAVDNIDIGGVALIRAAAKGALLNHRVAPVTSPQQYEDVARELDRNGKIGEPLRTRMAREAFTLTSDYDCAIKDYLERMVK